MKSEVSRESLEELYKDRSAHSHAAALEEIYRRGVEAGEATMRSKFEEKRDLLDRQLESDMAAAARQEVT